MNGLAAIAGVMIIVAPVETVKLTVPGGYLFLKASDPVLINGKLSTAGKVKYFQEGYLDFNYEKTRNGLHSFDLIVPRQYIPVERQNFFNPYMPSSSPYRR